MIHRDANGRFVKGFKSTPWNKGMKGVYKLTSEHKQNIALAKLGEKNPQWKGDKVGMDGLHEWLKRQLPRPDVCSLCKKQKKLELCNISNTYDPKTYTRELKNWKWLCYSCHMKTDGRIYNLRNQRFEQK